MKIIIILMLLMFSAANAAVNAIEFDTPQKTERYKTLIAELRCLVCQNQNLAASDAELAIDLKKIVQQKINAGESDKQILAFMTERYGDFVLYRPPFKSTTLLLWLGPVLLLIMGIVIIINFIKRSKVQTFNPTKRQREQVRELLDE